MNSFQCSRAFTYSRLFIEEKSEIIKDVNAWSFVTTHHYHWPISGHIIVFQDILSHKYLTLSLPLLIEVAAINFAKFQFCGLCNFFITSKWFHFSVWKYSSISSLYLPSTRVLGQLL